MKCRNCDAPCLPEAKFCSECGARLAATVGGCTRCGHPLQATDRFCSTCGHPADEPDAERPAGTTSADSLHRLMPRQYVQHLIASSGRATSERRVVTILFLDVVGSTAMGESLDPEEVLEIMNAAFEHLMQPVFRYEGTLARLTGDGLLCFFGAPLAHEDDPLRACRAALEIIEAAKEFGRTLETEQGVSGFAIRVGINTGMVVVGEVGSDMRVEYTAMGDAVNLAARIESLAEPNTVFISEATANRVRDTFELTDRGSFDIRGKKRPIRLYRLERFHGYTVPVATGRLQSPLVGRETEMAVIRDALQDLKNNVGSRLVITGEPGLGKSRLLAEAQKLLADDIQWVEGRGTSYSEQTAYAVVLDLFFAITGLDRDADPVDIGDEFRAKLSELFAQPAALTHDSTASVDHSIQECFAYLGHLMSIPLSEEESKLMANLTGQLLQQGVMKAFRSLLYRVASDRPLVLVCEDLHWADRASLSVLQSLLHLPEEAPVTLILVFRPNEGHVHDFHQYVVTACEQRTHMLELSPLDENGSVQLLANLIDLEHAPNELVRTIVNSTDGNALYLEEIVRSYLDADAAVWEGDRLTPTGEASVMPVPETLFGVVMSRIDRLAPRDRRILQTASVLGRSFHGHVLADTIERDITHSEAEAALTELVRREFLFPESPADGLDTEYSFKHAVTADVAYRSLLKSERRQLHRAAAVTMEHYHADQLDAHASALAHHFERGRDYPKAVAYSVRAAERAHNLFACHEAADAYRQALRLLERLGADTSDPGLHAKIHEGLGDVHYVLSEYSAAVDQFRAALDLHDDRYRRATLHRKCGEAFEKWGRYDPARESFEAALEEMGAILDEAEAARAYSGLCLVHYHAGQFDAAIELGNLALAMMTSLDDDRGVAQAYNNLGVVHSTRGDLESSLRCHERALELWERIDDTYGLASTHNNIGLVAHRNGNSTQAIEHLEESGRLFEQLGNRHGTARVLDNLSRIYSEQDQMEIAMDYLKRALRILTEIGQEQGELMPEMWQSGNW